MVSDAAYIASVITGTGVGFLAGLVALMFFEREIFGFLDWLVAKVRKICGLPPA